MRGHCFCSALDQQGQSGDCSVPPGWYPSANLSQTGLLAAKGPAEPDITLTPSLTSHCLSQFLCPPIPTSFLKIPHQRRAIAPPPRRTTCICVALSWRGRFNSLPKAFPFSSFTSGTKSLLTLGDARALTGMLQLPLPATGVITTLQKAPGCHFCFHGNKYWITENRVWCFMDFEAFHHFKNTLTHFYWQWL